MAYDDSKKQIMCPPGRSVLDYLRDKGIFISAPCGGGGTCGKCRVRLAAGVLPETEADRAFLSEDELKAGYRLACKAVPISPVRIELGADGEEDFFTESEQESFSGSEEKKVIPDESHVFGIALDIGTTTLAAALVDLTKKKELSVKTKVNRQRSFGADVISRIEAAMQGRGEELKKIIEKDIFLLVSELTGNKPLNIKSFVISANTAMYHFLLEKSVEGLAAWPFAPAILGGEELSVSDVFVFENDIKKQLAPDCKVKLIPGISAFVGGDITSGLISIDSVNVNKPFLFVDIGTNAEMALVTENDIYTASAAAGPALEGGNIRCGTGSVPGAISSVWRALPGTTGGNLPETYFKFATIKNMPPAGICGTGVLEAVSEFLRAGIIDKHGTFTQEYIEKGFYFTKHIALFQDDIRQVQMAKAAIRAGIDALIRASGVHSEDISELFISGGFGTYLDIKKAAHIGLIPPEFEGIAKAVGNTSLKGAVKVLLEPDADLQAGELCKAKTFEIANDEFFKDRYIECMDF